MKIEGDSLIAIGAVSLWSISKSMLLEWLSSDSLTVSISLNDNKKNDVLKHGKYYCDFFFFLCWLAALKYVDGEWRRLVYNEVVVFPSFWLVWIGEVEE